MELHVPSGDANVSEALLACRNCDSALAPPSTLYAMPCGKDRGLPSWKLYDIFGYQPEDLICELLPVIAHSQGDAKVRGSSLTQRWSSGGNVRSTEGKRGRLQGPSRFSEPREPSRRMSCILLAIGQEDFCPSSWSTGEGFVAGPLSSTVQRSRRLLYSLCLRKPSPWCFGAQLMKIKIKANEPVISKSISSFPKFN